jgi:hypothetical protein
MFKLLAPMPSPNGTNKARLYIPATWLGDNPVAAYDDARGLRADDRRRGDDRRRARDSEGDPVEGVIEALREEIITVRLD